MGGLFSNPGKDAAKMNKANVNKMMGIYESLYPQMMGQWGVAQGYANQQLPIAQAATLGALNAQKGAALSAKLAAKSGIQGAASQAQQNLTSRGLGGSTLADQIGMSSDLSTASAYAQIDQALAGMQAGTMLQGAGMQMNALGNMAGTAGNTANAQMGWGTGFAGALGGVQHTGGPSTFEQLLGIGAQLGTAAILAGSDRRLKTDIERIGTSPSGIPVYRFRYRQFPDHVWQGVMADEVDHVPGAVWSMHGWAWVDYSKLDVDFKRVA
jgi:hypothetical protein